MKKFIWILTLALLFGLTLAWWGTATSSSSKIVDPERVPPISNDRASYKFDETATKAMIKQDSSLLKLSCDWLKVLQNMGFADRAAKMFSVGVEEWEFDFSFDLRNCSMWWNKRNYNPLYKSLTEKKAFDYAIDFMKNPYLKGKLFDQLDKPVLLYKNSNWWGYPMMRDWNNESDYFSWINIDTNDTWSVEIEYTDFTIIYPYLINWKRVYNQYGGLAWITLNINSEWVNNVNAQLLPFIWAVRKSEKLTDQQLVDFVKNWWNNPFRWPSQQIKLDKPERITVLFSLRRNNITERYLSSWIRFGSKVKTDPYAQANYEMIMSDYKIWNNNGIVY
jgi:hypothetical protein